MTEEITENRNKFQEHITCIYDNLTDTKMKDNLITVRSMLAYFFPEDKLIPYCHYSNYEEALCFVWGYDQCLVSVEIELKTLDVFGCITTSFNDNKITDINRWQELYITLDTVDDWEILFDFMCNWIK